MFYLNIYRHDSGRQWQGNPQRDRETCDVLAECFRYKDSPIRVIYRIIVRLK